jgi:hypothetical protein
MNGAGIVGSWFAIMGSPISVRTKGWVCAQMSPDLFIVRFGSPHGPAYLFKLSDMVATPGYELNESAWVFFDSEQDLDAWAELLGT